MSNPSRMQSSGTKLRQLISFLVAVAFALLPCSAYGTEVGLELVAGAPFEAHLDAEFPITHTSASLAALDDENNGMETDGTVSKKSGTCTWAIDEQGTLTIAPQDGAEGTLGKWQNTPPWHDYCEKLTSARVVGTINAPSCRFFFDGCSKLTSVNLTGLDTSSATDMKCMFSGCSALRSLDLSPLDTSQVTTMNNMFSGCSALRSLDLWPLITWNVSDMDAMFANCASLQTLDLSPLDTSQATTMNQMFGGCSALQSLDLSPLDTSNVRYMDNMFNGCSALQSIDLSPIDASSMETAGSMFSDCLALESIYVNDSWPSRRLENSPYTFLGCTALIGGNGTTFDADRIDGVYARIDSKGAPGYLTYKAAPQTVNVTEGTWGTCSWEIDSAGALRVHPGIGGSASVKRTFLDGLEYEVSYWHDYAQLIKRVTFLEEGGRKVVAPSNSGHLLSYLGMESVDLVGLDTTQVKSMDSMFRHCSSLRTANLSSLDISNVTQMEYLFGNCTALHSVKLSGLDASGVSSMNSMFSGCLSLRSLQLASLRTSSISNMGSMFENCSSLQSLDLSDIDTSSVQDMSRMFYGCSSLRSFDLSGFDTSNAKDLSGMFEGCSSLLSLDLSGFNTSGVEHMDYMFNACSSLQSLDLSGFDTSNTTDMSGMFGSCSLLESLDLSSFDTSSLERCTFMFNDCYSLCTIFAGERWSSMGKQDGTNMFMGCSSLVGGNGTVYSDDHADAEYARIDAKGTPGYLTNKKPGSDNSPDPERTTRTSIAKATVKLSSAVFAYNGKAHTPKVSVALNGTKLKAGRDYSISYSAGRKNAGTYKLTVTGKGAYSSKASATFKVAKASLAKASVSLGKTSYPYNGKARTPSIAIRLGSEKLKAGRDFIVQLPKGRKGVGTYRVAVLGRGNFKGKTLFNFKIVPKTPTLKSLTAHKNSNGTSGFIAEWSKSAKKGCGYQLRWSRTKKFGACETVSFASTSPYAKTTTAALRVRTAKWHGKRIYVQVRSFQDAKEGTLYSTWSKAKTIMLKK